MSTMGEPHPSGLKTRPLFRAEYDGLVELGAFEDEHIELIEGVLVEMSPEGGEHAAVIQELTWLFARGVSEDLRVRVAAPWAASDRSEPEPDLAVVPAGLPRTAHPDVALLLVEVSYSSRRIDLGLKAAVYDAAGVPEYWVVDLVHQVVHRHVGPTGWGYEVVTQHQSGERLSACGVDVDLAALLGAR